MQLYKSIEELQLASSWVTIGSFDGVHLGHQAIIRAMVEGAHAAGLPAVVITFDPHPVVFLRAIKDPFYLTDPHERAKLISNLGVDHIITLTFDHFLAEKTALEFTKILVNHLGLNQLWTGIDFKLGKNREGTTQRLAEIGQELGFIVRTLLPAESEGEVISSSRIRQLLQRGEVERASQLLGRFYSLVGDVVHGDERGREIGVPTANLKISSDRLLPMRGVYATMARLKNQSYFSVTNIGFRPTFGGDSSLRVETHLLDFSRSIYNQPLTIEFYKLLRTEHQFPSKNELVNQLNLDISQARKVLSDAKQTPGISARP